MSTASMLFHIGLHKTATSSLQQDFFVESNGFLQNGGRAWILPTFVDKSATQLLTELEGKELRRFAEAARSQGLMPVVSHERLSGYPLSGGYDRLSILNRISKAKVDAKILLVVREQKRWLYSAWKQMINDGGAIGLRAFIQPEVGRPQVRVPPSRLAYLDYGREVRLLHDMFGADNVCVLPMELLIEDFARFKSALATVCQLDPTTMSAPALTRRNESSALSSLYVEYLFNRFLLRTATSRSGVANADGRLGRILRTMRDGLSRKLPEIPFQERVADRHKAKLAELVGDRYRQTNAEASELIGVNLADYGYDTG